MRIAVMALSSPHDRWSWSGIPYYSCREIVRRFPDTVIVDTPRLDWMFGKAGVFRKIGLVPQGEPAMTWLIDRIVHRRVEEVRPDVIVSISATTKVAGLAARWPVVHATDGMFGSIVRFYPRYARLNARHKRLGDALQERLCKDGKGFLFASDWAAGSAREIYGLPESLAQVAPFGANLDEDPGPCPVRNTSGPLRLLFVGFDWIRKGGPLALDIFKQLKQRVPSAELHLVACPASAGQGIEGVHHHGIIDKSNPSDVGRLNRLFSESSFFLMPSRAETFGIVYCEACAFGLPPIATVTGGVPTIVHDGENGILLPQQASAHDFVERMLAIWNKPDEYAAMQRSARQHFEERLNWRAWGEKMEQAILKAACS